MNVNFTRLLFVLLTTSILFQCMIEDKISEPRLERVAITSKVDQKERDFFVYLPKGYENDLDKKWPVILFLHGNGERGDGKEDLDYTMIHGPLMEAWVQKRDLPFIMIAPQLPMFGRDEMGIGYIDNRNKDQVPQRMLNDEVPKRSAPGRPNEVMTGVPYSDTFPGDLITLDMGWEQVEADLLNTLDSTHAKFRTDLSRVYLTGLSYGGFGTWNLASKHPNLFAAIAPIVGWGHPSLMKPLAEASLPIWAFAGGRDNVIQPKYFYQGINELERLGHDHVRFTIEADMGHDTWKRIYAGEDLYNWLLAHMKSN